MGGHAGRQRLARWAGAGAIVLAAACGQAPHDDDGYVEKGDLPALRERGELRIVMPRLEPETLPRRGFSLERDLELARGLAAELELVPDVRTVPERDRMIEEVLEGRADLVIADLTATESRRERLAFSVPLGHVREIVVVRTAETAPSSVEDLVGRTAAVRRGSSYFETLERLRGDNPGIGIQIVPEHLDTEQILDGVARGVYDLTLADDALLEAVLAYRDDLSPAFAVTGPRPIGWAMRPDSLELKRAVDRFLDSQALTLHLRESMLGDLDAIRERKVLRVLTRNNAATYFLHRGKQVGFEFELSRRFAESLGCRLQVVVPPEADLLLPWLLEGRGDLVAASLTVTPARRERVAFTRPYNRVKEVVVAAAADRGLRGPADLEGRTVAVRPSSSYRQSLEQLRGKVDFEILDAPEDLETEDLIAMVAEGEYELTVADSNIVDIEMAWRDDIRRAFALEGEREIAWAVRPQDGKLLEAADAFLRREYRGTFYNILCDRYFTDRSRIARVVPERPALAGRLSPWDDLFRECAARLDIDWRLLAAQAYQESRFDPGARSWAGARGIMQLLPRTAREVGVEGDIHDPARSIRAGSLYLASLIERFEPTLPRSERIRFALAAYNVGRGHVLDGRRVAREIGLDPDVWFDNVERALPLLGRPRYARNARYGYCRCREPVRYVREINERYAAYSRVVD